jgi:hypothetical protein
MLPVFEKVTVWAGATALLARLEPAGPCTAVNKRFVDAALVPTYCKMEGFDALLPPIRRLAAAFVELPILLGDSPFASDVTERVPRLIVVMPPYDLLPLKITDPASLLLTPFDAPAKSLVISNVVPLPGLNL